MKNFPDFVDKDTLIVVNNSKVRKARLYGISETGGRVEFLLTKRKSPVEWIVVVSKRRNRKPGKSIHFPEELQA